MKRLAVRLLLLLALLLAGCSSPPEVEVLSPVRGDLSRSFTEQARTRLSRTWTVRMPVTGRVSRVGLEPGDRVRAGQPIATVDRVALDARSSEAEAQVAEIRARMDATADAGVEEARAREAAARVAEVRSGQAALEAEVRSAEAALAQASREAARQASLFQRGFVARQVVEQARLEETTARERVAEVRSRLRQQQAAVSTAAAGASAASEGVTRRTEDVDVLARQLEGAEARLREALHEASQAVLEAPVAGVVLERFEEGPGLLQAGTSVIEIGRLADMEAVAEVLTEDALLLKVGTPVHLTAGEESFAGRVKRIDPAGFTKPSSLGVEQQRVDVILALQDPPPDLGVGWQMQARFVTETRRDVLLIPRFSVLQAPSGEHFVYLVDGGVLRRRPITLGVQGDQRMEVVDGLGPQDAVVAVPDSTMEDGQKVSPVSAPGPG